MKTKVGDYVRVCYSGTSWIMPFLNPEAHRIVKIKGHSIIIETQYGNLGPFRSWVRVKSSTREGGK